MGLSFFGSLFCCWCKRFLGTRTLRADGHHSEQTPVANGLVAGSSQANHLARAVLHRCVAVCGRSQDVHGRNHKAWSGSANQLFHSHGKLKVDLSSSKCGFVATTRGIALTVCSGCQYPFFGISSTRHARDLGVDVS